MYFGEIGENSRTLLNYFEANGGRECGEQENPAEYMLEIVNKGTNPRGVDWHDVWTGSPEREDVIREIERIRNDKSSQPAADGDEAANNHSEFAASFAVQTWAVTVRVFQQYWRTPSYIAEKFILSMIAGLFIGFSFFQSNDSLAGMQNVLFAVFMVITIFSTVVQQVSSPVHVPSAPILTGES